MNKVNHGPVRAAQVMACLLLGAASCGGLTPNAPILSQTETTSAAVPTANGTYDRSLDPSASNAGEGTTAMHAPLPPSFVGSRAEAPLTDGQIAGLMSGIDTAEIDAGRLALSRSHDPNVRQFALRMVSTHQAAESELNAVLSAQGLTPSQSALCNNLVLDSRTRAQALAASADPGFDRAYMTSELQDHEALLALLNNQLVDEAKSPPLRSSLEATRVKVLDHIQMAKEVLGSLPGR
jgi:putative membrane protein